MNGALLLAWTPFYLTALHINYDGQFVAPIMPLSFFEGRYTDMNYLYSVVLELSATNTATIPATMGHQAHALFLNMIRKVDPDLAVRLHEEPGYRPFTVSPLSGGQIQGKHISLQAGQALPIGKPYLPLPSSLHHVTFC
jgi:hypothetical protein